MVIDLSACLGYHDRLPPTHLHKEEVTALVMLVGRASGFVVRMEVAARWAGTNARPPCLDCGWYDRRTDRLIVAWEFDGRDVGNDHIAGNRRKFAGCEAPIKIQVLYSAKNDLRAKPASRLRNVEALLRPLGVRVVADEALMAPSAVLRSIVDEATAIALPRR